MAFYKANSAVAYNWEQYKETIRNLYIERNYTLQQLIQEIRTLYGFDITQDSPQSDSTWAFKKNRKKREWIEIAEQVIETKRQ